MAYVEIHAVTQTLDKAFGYAHSDKEIIVTDKDDLGDAYAYAARDKAHYETLTTGINCPSGAAVETSELYRLKSLGTRKTPPKNKQNQEVIGYHCIQTFKESPAQLSPEKAHEIGVALAKKLFGNFPVTVSTHCNTEHVHNHFVFGAYGADGKKYHDCKATYQAIRTASDVLCDEHGLHVTENTRKVRLVPYTDDHGKRRSYEPTDRKNALRLGEFSEANDYRNSAAFERHELYRETQRDFVRDDIDRAVPACRCYEDLVFALRQAGYTVRDKKKDGEWLAHVSFRPPKGKRGMRDSSLGKAYTREALTVNIEAAHLQSLFAIDDRTARDLARKSVTLDAIGDDFKMLALSRKIALADGEVSDADKTELGRLREGYMYRREQERQKEEKVSKKANER